MPLTLTSRWLTRVTMWHDQRGDVVQVAVGILEADTWDLQCEATERVGPFDDLETAHAAAWQRAINQAERQLQGQQRLL